MIYALIALLLTVWLLIRAPRRRVESLIAQADNIIETVERPAITGPNRWEIQREKAEMMGHYNELVTDHNKLLFRYRLIKDKTSTRGQALARRLAEKALLLQQFQQAARNKYPEIR